jgi:uncharacterized repeat protein (TIGR02543 family)
VTWISDAVASTLAIGDTDPVGSEAFFAGGGGGGFHTVDSATAGDGGSGGGGDGIGPNDGAGTFVGEAGAATTGGGGGGSGAPSGPGYVSEGGAGGSGVVVISYALANTVTFKSNYAGGGSDTTQSITSGVATALTSNSFTRTGYTFAGWDEAADGSGTDYTNGESVTLTAALPLYAKWTADSLTVTWNSKSGSAVSSTTVDTAANLSAPAAPTRAGFHLTGWSATDGGAVVSFPYSHPNTASFTMYAVWERASYIMSFDQNFTGDTDSTSTYYSGDSVTLPTPTRDGYIFNGWYTASTGGTRAGDAGDSYSPLSASDLVLRYELDDPASYAGTGATITDIASEVSSVTGSVDGTAINGPTFSTSDGMSFTMDGTNDYIRTGNLLSRVGSGNRISVFAWVYPTGNGVIVSELGTTTISSDWHDSQIEVVGGKFKFRTWSPSGSATPAVTSDSITLNQWYYVGLTYDGSKLVGYVNGESVGQTTAYTRSAPSTGLYYALGATDSSNLGDGTYGDFKLGSFHVYKSGLSAATVLDNFQATCARFDESCTEQTLFAQWQIAGYAVTYAAGDNGTGATQTVSKTHAVTLTLPDSATANSYFTRTGYTVTGWNTDSDGTSGTDFALGANYTTNAAEDFYPVWTADTYTVTYDAGDNGTGSDETATKTYAVTLTLPDSATANGYFTRTGYTVTGWNTDSDGTSGTGYALGANYTINAADTFYPVWTLNTYTVTYTYNGATGGNASATSSFTVGSVVISLPTPTKTGFTFAGWYSNVGLTDSVGAAGASYSPTADITIYAKWTAATFTVIYDYNGATGSNSTASSTYTTGSTLISLPTPTKTGYTFGGWYSNSNLTSLSTVGAGGASYSPTTNLTVYAKWTAITRSVTYEDTNATSGSAPTDSGSYVIAGTVIVRANSGSLVRTGYTFAGWTVASDGSGSVLNSGQSVTVATADITFYPKWSANTYTITFHKNGASGTLAAATDTYTTGDSNITLPGAGTMTKTGYTFGGWATSPSGSSVGSTYNTTQDITLYAIWTIKSITYSYAKGQDSAGTSLSSQVPTFPTGSSSNYGTSVTLSNSITQEIDSIVGDAGVDHKFFGWSDGSTVYQGGDSFILGDSNPTFTAQWAKVYAVRYALAGGSFAGSDAITDSECGGGSSTCTNGQVITLNAAPSRSGYTFDGWQDQSSTLKAADSSTTISNTSYLFYAQWKVIEYNMGFNSLGGSNAVANQTKTIGQQLTMPNPGTKTGYTFGGWSDGTDIFSVGNAFTVGASSKSFIAEWIANVYTQTYDWQGGISSTPKTSDNYTVGSSALVLPTAVGSGYSKDGYDFAGWSTNPAASADSAVSSITPTADDVLYAIWDDGNYTLSYDAQGGSAGSGLGTVARTYSVTLPTPVREGFVFLGWYTAASGGSLLGVSGASYTPTASTTFYARWVQRSLFGVDLATLETAATLTVGSGGTGGSISKDHSTNGTRAAVVIPTGALPENTVVTVRYFRDTTRQSAVISSENNYIFSILVSWLTGTGTTATVPNTAAGKPLVVTLTSSAIKAGQRIFQVIGDSVTELGLATVDGSIVVELTEDPEIVVASTKSSAPQGVSVTTGDSQATISWSAPSSTGGAAITGYTVTTSPGSGTCTTAITSCTITGLSNGTTYTFNVVANNSVGASPAASSNGTVALPSYAVTFDSDGGSSVVSGSFVSGGSVAAPADPTRSGYSFNGWSTTLDNTSTKVTFAYSPGVTQAITLYALWTAISNAAPARPAPAAKPVETTKPTEPKLPTSPVTKPVGVIEGSTETVNIVADAPKEKLVATGSGWELKVSAKVTKSSETGSEPEAQLEPVAEDLSLRFQLASRAQVEGSGLRPNTEITLWVFSDPTYVGQLKTGIDGSFVGELDLPASILPGKHTLQIRTTDSLGRVITLDLPITVVGKVTVGTFKGYLALYTKDLMGQKLSARVAGKWLVQDPLTKYKDYNYSRVLRKTGAGYRILVDLYLNGTFLRRDVITTR